MIGSTIVSSLGMLALCLSSFSPTARFGYLMAAQMIASFLGELLTLPAMLCFRPDRRKKLQSQESGNAGEKNELAEQRSHASGRPMPRDRHPKHEDTIKVRPKVVQSPQILKSPAWNSPSIPHSENQHAAG